MIRNISLTLLLTMACSLAFAEQAPVIDPAVKANRGPTDAQAIEWLTAGAAQGDPFAQFNLGYKYHSGEGVTKDIKKAVFWYTKAAEKGLAEAQVKMGEICSNGQGVPKDDKQAFAWYSKAAEQGHGTAQNALGQMYNNGQGVTKNTQTAYAWFSIAAGNGNSQAVTNKAALTAKLKPNELKEAARTADDLAKMIKEKKSVKK